MADIRNQHFLGVLLSLSILLTVDAWAGEQTITRDIVGFQLGMSLQETSKLFRLEEKEDGTIALMRKFKFGDPEKQSQINKKLGKRVFAAKGNFAKGVASIQIFFRNDFLYQIALHYGKDYVQNIDWDLFTLPAIKKYGQPNVSNNIEDLASFSYHWTDGRTKLEIAKGGTLSKDKSKFVTSIYNVFYTDIETYNTIKKDEKKEKERLDIPDF